MTTPNTAPILNPPVQVHTVATAEPSAQPTASKRESSEPTFWNDPDAIGIKVMGGLGIVAVAGLIGHAAMQPNGLMELAGITLAALAVPVGLIASAAVVVGAGYAALWGVAGAVNGTCSAVDWMRGKEPGSEGAWTRIPKSDVEAVHSPEIKTSSRIDVGAFNSSLTGNESGSPSPSPDLQRQSATPRFG